MTVKYPDVRVVLTGGDGNAYAILAACRKAMRKAGIEDKWEEFHAEATSGEYDHLLQTAMRWFDVD